MTSPTQPTIPGFLQRLIATRDWIPLAREHSGGALQVSVMLWAVVFAARWGLTKVRDREVDSAEPDLGFIEVIGDINVWLARISTLALLVAVGAAIVQLFALWVEWRHDQASAQSVAG